MGPPGDGTEGELATLKRWPGCEQRMPIACGSHVTAIFASMQICAGVSTFALAMREMWALELEECRVIAIAQLFMSL